MENKKWHEANYFKSKGSKILSCVHYYPNEVFLATPYFPNIIIGNFGTIVDARTRMKMVPTLDPYRNPVIHTNYSYGNIRYRSLKIAKAIMVAHCPIDDMDNHVVVHLNSDTMQNIYAPGTPWNNLKWIPKSKFSQYMIQAGVRGNCPSASVSMLNDSDVHRICQLLSEGLDNSEVIFRLGWEDNKENRYKIVSIRSGMVRKDIVSQYTFPGPRRYFSHTDEEVHIVCQYLSKYRPLNYSLSQIKEIIKKDTGKDIKPNFISALWLRTNAKWKYITDQYIY